MDMRTRRLTHDSESMVKCGWFLVSFPTCESRTSCLLRLSRWINVLCCFDLEVQL